MFFYEHVSYNLGLIVRKKKLLVLEIFTLMFLVLVLTVWNKEEYNWKHGNLKYVPNKMKHFSSAKWITLYT